MTPPWKYLSIIVYVTLSCFLCICATAQSDTIPISKADTLPARTLEDYLKNRNGFFAKIVKSFMKDTIGPEAPTDIRRNDIPFLKYEGYHIRNININELPFGIPINDSARKIITTLTKLANATHRVTRPSVIRRNLFFKRNDAVQPYLLADNLRFLRQLPYIQDASFRIEGVPGTLDSVDITVITKDVFSIGGSLGSLGVPQSDIEIREDNFAGSGNAIVFQTLFDTEREKKFGLGAAFIQRNIGGSFMNGEFAYKSFYNSIDGPKEENLYYINLSKPLETRYMKWTYEFLSSYHSTRNMYNDDSVYLFKNNYQYYNFDAWAGYNINSKNFSIENESTKLRRLAGVRIIERKFQDIPLKYQSDYYWRFADLTGVLGSLTLYRQNFYKARYIYGFGRNEDIPEGLNLTVTSGLTRKQNILRPFLGFNYERSFFNERKNYISYTLRAEGNLHHSSIEDITMLAGISYVESLNTLGPKWLQRFFLSMDVAQQVNTVLNEPLLLASKYGLPEFGNNRVGGTLRATVRAESVFYSPWSVAAFRIAPFVFANTSVFSPYLAASHLYSSVGGGIRTRNESLLFGTLELKGYYFPGGNIRNEKFRFDIATNVRFKYNPQLIRKPNFIEIN